MVSERYNHSISNVQKSITVLCYVLGLGSVLVVSLVLSCQPEVSLSVAPRLSVPPENDEYVREALALVGGVDHIQEFVVAVLDVGVVDSSDIGESEEGDSSSAEPDNIVAVREEPVKEVVSKKREPVVSRKVVRQSDELADVKRTYHKGDYDSTLIYLRSVRSNSEFAYYTALVSFKRWQRGQENGRNAIVNLEKVKKVYMGKNSSRFAEADSLIGVVRGVF